MKLRTHAVARAAWDCVDARRRDLAEQPRRKYGAIAHKLPGLILRNGLAQASGFLLAKGAGDGTDHHLLLLDDLNAVLRAGGSTDAADRDALHRRIIEADLPQTLRLTRSALEASGWLKRYVQGLLRISATGDPAEDNDAN